ncbi:MAG: PQQ-like beta-propeller repeat protein [Phycisphaerae bacterium]|nr:PQQ-like beta-propeller repeat protein [Phycisphaerae bacterium]
MKRYPTKPSTDQATAAQHLSAGNLTALIAAALVVVFAVGASLRGQALLRINPGGPMIRAVPRTVVGKPHAGGKNNPTFRLVQVNDSFGAADLMRKARRLLSSGHTASAMRLFQKIADKYGNKVIRGSGDVYVTIQRRVWSILLALPLAERSVYDQIYGPEAQTKIRTAIGEHNLTLLLQAGRRYFPSRVAAKGLSLGASWLFERGDFGEAAQLWVSLLKHPGMTSQRPMLLFRAALAAHLGGEDGLSSKLAARLSREFPKATGLFGGQQVNLVAALAAARARRSWLETAARHLENGWPTYAGNNRRNRIAHSHSLPGALLWTDALGQTAGGPNAAINPAQQAQLRQQKIQVFSLGAVSAWLNGQPQIMYAFPTAGMGTIYVNTSTQIIAFNEASGFVLWRYPAAFAAASNQPGGSFNMLASSVDHLECALAGNKLYTILPTQGPQAFNPYGWGGLPPVRLICLDRRNGRLVWSRTSSTLAPPALQGTFTLMTSPMVEGSGVYVLACTASVNAAEQMYLLRLNRHTGAVVWREYLCSIAAQGYGPPAKVNAVLSMAGGVVNVDTGFGATMAIDARLGTIVWLHLTPRPPVPENQMYFNGLTSRTLPWQVNAPLAYHGLVITCGSAAAIGHIYVYAQSNGQIVRTIVCHNPTGALMTLGVVDDQLVVAGRRVQAFDLASGKLAWHSSPIAQFGILLARPVLTSRFVYLPMKEGLLRVAVGTGMSQPLIPWPAAGKNKPGLPGNLLVTRQEIITVNDDAITAYARWKTALAYDLAQIKEHPNDPLKYLTLSAIAFRTGHDRLSRRMMQLAAAKANAAASPDLTILDRIFHLAMSFGNLLRHDRTHRRQQESLFYYRIASLVARSNRQQVAWRMNQAESYVELLNAHDALALLEEILARSGYRNAPLQRANGVMLAGIAAEAEISNAIITRLGVAAYQPAEMQALALLAAHPDDLLRVIHRFPNSTAATTAAWKLIAVERRNQQWGLESKLLIWLKNHLTDPTQKARVVADMIGNNLHRGHWNTALALARRGAELYPTFSWPSAGKTIGFGQQVLRIQRLAPPEALYHLPYLVYRSGDALTVRAPIAGLFLKPLDRARALQRSDILLVANTIGTGTQVACYDSATMALRWKTTFPVPHIALIGFVHDYAILAAPDQAMCVRLADGTVHWTASLAGPQQMGGALDGAVRQQSSRVVVHMMINGMVIGAPVAPNNGLLAFERAFAHNPMQLQQLLGPTAYVSLKIVGDELIEIGNQSLAAMSLKTGRPVWGAPMNLSRYGQISRVLGTGDLLVALMDYPVKTMVVVEEVSGKVEGAIGLPPGEHAAWAAAGPDGTLYVVGWHNAMAYNLSKSMNAPVWNRLGLDVPFPQASALSQDGLIITEGTGLCSLRLRDGAKRWQVDSIAAGGTAQVPMAVATFLNRDTAVVVSPRSVTALSTRSGQTRWRAVFMKSRTPPFSGVSMANPDMALLAQGPLGTTQRAVKLFLINQQDHQGRLDNGTVELNQRLVESARSPQGPLISDWTVVNDGLVFEINDTVCVYHIGP